MSVVLRMRNSGLKWQAHLIALLTIKFIKLLFNINLTLNDKLINLWWMGVWMTQWMKKGFVYISHLWLPEFFILQVVKL